MVLIKKYMAFSFTLQHKINFFHIKSQKNEE